MSRRRLIMRSSAALLFCLLVVQPLTRAEIETENHVLILTNENFDEAIRNHKYIAVHFVPSDSEALWEDRTAEYAKAALELAEKKSELKLGKVDFTKQTEIKECLEIDNYPRLKFFREGEPIEYVGSGTASAIVHWLKKKSAPPAEISTPEELTAFKEARKFVVIGFFKDRDSDAAKAFLKFATGNDAWFGISSDDAVYAAAEAEDGQVVLLKKYDEGRNVLEKVGSAEQVREFVAFYSLPLVMDATETTESLPEIYTLDGKSRFLEMYLLIDKQIADYEKIYANYRKAAKRYRGAIIFRTVYSDYFEYANIMRRVGLKESDTPRMRIFRRSDFTKFKPENETDFEPAAISAFVQAVVHGEIKPYFLSQDLPDDWDKAPVKVLVGTNFDRIAFDKSKNVLVGFLSRSHPPSRELEPILEQLGEHFRNNDQIVIAKFDASANELEHTETDYRSYGTLKLYKKNTNEVVDYKGERTFKELKEFVETNSDYN